MKKRYRATTQLKVYELLDRAIATSDKATFDAQLAHLIETRQARGFSFNDHRPAVLPARKAFRALTRRCKELFKYE